MTGDLLKKRSKEGNLKGDILKKKTKTAEPEDEDFNVRAIEEDANDIEIDNDGNYFFGFIV